MKTVILCGGMGTRLKEETEFKPKPMVTIGGKPILWHIMKIYAHHGYNEFIIALGYKGEMIKEYFLNQKYFTNDFTLETKTGETQLHIALQNNQKENEDFKITFVDTGQESLTGERLRRLRKYLNGERFMCTYGDGVANINLNHLIEFHEKKKVMGTIAGVHPHSRWGLVKIDQNQLATEFRQKPNLKKEVVNGGFMVLENEFIDYIEEGEMIEAGFERLVKEKQLAVYNHDDFWFAMDTYQDLEQLNKLWNNEKNPPWKVWENDSSFLANDRSRNKNGVSDRRNASRESKKQSYF